MNQKPKIALDTLKKSAELGEKAINSLEEYVNEMESRLLTPKHKLFGDVEVTESLRPFIPSTVEDEYRNKLFIRLMNNFTFTELEHMEKLGKNCFDKNKNYKDH